MCPSLCTKQGGAFCSVQRSPNSDLMIDEPLGSRHTLVEDSMQKSNQAPTWLLHAFATFQHAPQQQVFFWQKTTEDHVGTGAIQSPKKWEWGNGQPSNRPVKLTVRQGTETILAYGHLTLQWKPHYSATFPVMSQQTGQGSTFGRTARAGQ